MPLLPGLGEQPLKRAADLLPSPRPSSPPAGSREAWHSSPSDQAIQFSLFRAEHIEGKEEQIMPNSGIPTQVIYGECEMVSDFQLTFKLQIKCEGLGCLVRNYHFKLGLNWNIYKKQKGNIE